MKFNKLIYAVSTALVMLALVLATAPEIINFLNRNDEQTLSYILSFLIAYVGLGAAMLVKIRDARKKRIEKRKKIFLIYSRPDFEKVNHIANELKKIGFDIWMNDNDFLPGQILEKKIKSVLDESVAAILFVSENPLSEFSMHELSYLLKSRSVRDDGFIPVLPVRINNGELPAALQGVVYVNYEDSGLIDKLARSLSHLLEAKVK